MVQDPSEWRRIVIEALAANWQAHRMKIKNIAGYNIISQKGDYRY